MARAFRWLGKKRGGRSTGSRLLGGLSEAVFFGTLFLVGLSASAALILSQVVNPDPEVLRPGVGFWMALMVLISFVMIGSGGVLFAALQLGVSAERRSAMTQKASQIDLLTPTLPTAVDYPTIPRDVNITNSPGSRLPYHLPAVQFPEWTLTGTALFTLVWNGVATVLTTVAINGHLTGHHEWFLTICLLPFWIVGVWSAQSFLRQIWLRGLIGPTTLEISAFPLYPGKSYGLYISQSGRFALDTFELLLVCEEEATYHQGTDIRTERRLVHRLEIFQQRKLQLDPMEPLELDCVVQMPPSVMHSFRSQHNAVHWKLIVRGTARLRTLMERTYPIVVYPSQKDRTDGTAH